MENLNRILSISTLAVLLSACQAQYKTTDNPANQRATPAATPTPTPANTSRTPEPIRNPPPRAGGVQNRDGSAVRTQPVPRDPVVNPGGGEWTNDGTSSSARSGSAGPGAVVNRAPPPVVSAPSAPAPTRTSPDRPITTVVVRDSREQVVTVSAGTSGGQGPCLCQDLTLWQSNNIVTNKIDLLFIVDPKVAAKDREDIANTVLDHVPQGIDYNVAVLPAYSSASSLSGALYAPANEEKVLNMSATDKAAAMSWSRIRSTLRDRMLDLPLETGNAKPNERGLTALSNALNSDGHLYNFVTGGMNRKGAALAVIIVGDINDEKDFKVNDLLARIKQIKRDMPITINGFFSQPSISANQRGYGYLEMIRLAHGHAVHMTRINEGLTDIGENILFNLYATIPVTLQYRSHYNGEEISVTVDGVKHSKNIGYYDQQTGKYQLHTVGRAGSKVRIEFCK